MSLTIYDISEKANVSIATVSRVLNGSTKVKESTRKKILDIIEEYNYTPNASARAMSSQSMKTIGILCADSSDIFLAKAIYYIEQELAQNGYESLLCCTGYDQNMKKHYVDLILSKKIDALIFVGSNFIGFSNEENQYIKDSSKKLPVMLLNASLDYPNVYSTLCDDEASMVSATKEMLKSGVKNILYVYNSKSYSSVKKLSGFKKAMKDIVSEEVLDDCLLYISDPMASIEDVADEIATYAQTHSFDGIICADDNLAMSAIKYAKRNNLDLPGDLSVIGYNNSMLTSCCTPELTSVDNKLETLTHQLVKTLMGVLNGEELPKKSIFDGVLVKRGTTR